MCEFKGFICALCYFGFERNKEESFVFRELDSFILGVIEFEFLSKGDRWGIYDLEKGWDLGNIIGRIRN